MSTLVTLFERTRQPVPSILSKWVDRVAAWCEDYTASYPGALQTELNLGPAAFLFDHTFERVTIAYAISEEQLTARDANRMRGFPNVNASVRAVLGDKAFPADRGHFLGHASGGQLDINLFPHKRDLNRGWSPEGKKFRAMERYVAENPGTFFYHRPLYGDNTWVPESLEYGVLLENSKWWTDVFQNR